MINFNAAYDWSEISVYNLLADMGSPRLPVVPNQSNCVTKAGKYSPG